MPLLWSAGIIGLSLLLAACSRMPYGSPSPISEARWSHETKTRDDFDRDRYECERHNSGVNRQRVSEMRDRCMLFKGWKRR